MDCGKEPQAAYEQERRRWPVLGRKIADPGRPPLPATPLDLEVLHRIHDQVRRILPVTVDVKALRGADAIVRIEHR